MFTINEVSLIIYSLQPCCFRNPSIGSINFVWYFPD